MSNDAGNSALIRGIHYILLFIHINTVILNCTNISRYYCLLNAALVSRKDCLGKLYIAYVLISE